MVTQNVGIDLKTRRLDGAAGFRERFPLALSPPTG
jgi:hypothetical protein